MNDQHHDPEFERKYAAGITRARELSTSLEGPSVMQRLARLPPAQREAIWASFSVLERARLRYAWQAWARPKQRPPIDSREHRVLFFMGGRGSGKTLAAAQRVRERVQAGARSIALIGPNITDTVRYMVSDEGGADGVQAVFPKSQRPVHFAEEGIVRFHTGAVAYLNSAEKPEFRGPNLDTVWCDEPAKWRYLHRMFNNIEMATRLRRSVPLEIIVSGTPLPLRKLKEIIADEDTITLLMRQAENAINLDPGFIRSNQRKFAGTRWAAQEIDGELLTDNPDALFKMSVLDDTRMPEPPKDLVEIVVSVDPAISQKPENDDTGIVVAGRDVDGHLYILEDLTMKATPDVWGAAVVKAYQQHRASAVVVERNRGGDLVAGNVRAATAALVNGTAAKAIKIVEVHATRGKYIRAEPVSALHEQRMIHIVDTLPKLEDEITQWNPRVGGVSPNRLDALVWAVWYLAKLGEDTAEKKDYSAGFKGLAGAVAAMRPAPGAQAAPLASLPRSGWGSGL